MKDEEMVLFGDVIKLAKEYYEKLQLPDDKSLHKFLLLHLMRFGNFLAQGVNIGYYSYKLIKGRVCNLEYQTTFKWRKE